MAVYPSIKIEGGLLGPDLLDQVVGADVPGQKPADFGLDGKRNLTDEIAATFADARALWGVFQNRLERLPEGDVATTVTRDAWMIPFLGLLGYAPSFNQRAYEIDGLSFAISHRADEAEKAPPVHIVGYRQELGRVPASGRPRLAPHSLVQEFLNRTENLWGLVTNGRILRLLRDCSYIRRQAYIEFDLQAMLEEQRFQDFAALYRLLHRTRLPRTDEVAVECLLEKYYAHSIEQGGRVRDHLRDGVEQCILRLANGFLRHPASDALRRRVAPDCADNDRITAEDFYRQLLRLVYRFLFLLVSEDRGLLSTDPLYREHYGVARLRRLLDNRAAFTEHDDLWQSLRVLWYLLNNDTRQPLFNDQPMAAALGLPVLNGELFAGQPLDSALISNFDLLDAFFYLAKYEAARGASWQRVNYSALDVEELGSVYESLLDFHPAVQRDAAGRLTFDLVFGSERKSTGSYYTPPELVGELIKSALEPVLADRLKASPKAPEKAILSIRVCDPACGSGHFLLAAARRLGKELARVRTGEDEPAPERVREAIRDVVSHCIYGVDKNPLAVDLCRVALWLESHTASKPLTFLDHRIRPGDSLIGVFSLDVLRDGIPDEAFKPLEGDEKEFSRQLARQNREERADQARGQARFQWQARPALSDFTQRSRELDAITDDSPGDIRRKREQYEQNHADPAWRRQREACDLYTAAFFQPLRRGSHVVTSGVLADHLVGRGDAQLVASARALAERQQFFHWPLWFPEVLTEGGFDVVLGNPPWGQKTIAADDRTKHFVTTAFPSAAGIFDVFRPFLELGIRACRPGGTVGFVLPDIVLLKNYEPSRALVLEASTILAIDWWRQPFPAALIDAITLALRRDAASNGHVIAVTIHDPERPMSRTIPQIEFQHNERRTFNLFLNAENRSFLDSLSGCPRVGEFFEVHEGVHSGNIRRELFVQAKIDDTSHPLIQAGSEVTPYHIEWSGRFIRLGAVPQRKTPGRYANVGRPEWHQAMKVLVRRTGDRIIAAVDSEGRYVSNNLFLVLPCKQCALDLWGLCALLNSKLMTSYFRMIEPREGRVFAEVKIKHISSFPIPGAALTDGGCERLNALGAQRSQLPESKPDQAAALDEAIEFEVARSFGISAEITMGS